MTQHAILWPMLAYLLFTCLLFIPLAIRKKHAISQGEVDRNTAALEQSAWPAKVRQLNNNINNQFQVPLLFYVLCLSFFITDTTGFAAVVLAWVFVGSRLLHSFIHIGSNYVPHRMKAFAAGLLILLAMLMLLLGQLINSG